MSMIMESKIENFKKGNYIYNINDKVRSVYFIKQGEVEIFKEIQLDPKKQ